MSVSSTYVTLSMQEGAMEAYLSQPSTTGKSFPAIIVAQEAFGVNQHIRNITHRLASAGYVAIAPELFHRTAPPRFEAPYTDFSAVMPHTKVMTNEGLEADMRASYEWLQQQPFVKKDKIATVGFCLGGRAAMIANAALPLAAAVSYYAGNTATLLNQLQHIHAPQLMVWGGLDKHITPDQVNAVVKTLNIAGKPYINTVFSDADHGFNCDDRASYQPRAAKEAWTLTLAFLENHLG